MADSLGLFEQAVLLAVIELGDAAYGRAILAQVQVRLKRAVAPGAVHATLNRLEGKRLLKSRLGPGTEIRAGHPRRYYVVHAKGRVALNDARETVDNICQGVN